MPLGGAASTHPWRDKGDLHRGRGDGEQQHGQVEANAQQDTPFKSPH